MVRFFYQLARILNDIFTLLSGNPARIAKRAGNKFIGRKFIRKLWFK